MVTAQELYGIRTARSFVPFRLVLTDGRSVDVIAQDGFIVGRQFTVVGLHDPKRADSLIDGWTTIYYTHITRLEPIQPGTPPSNA